MLEIWKPCISYPQVEASNLGRIRLAEQRVNYRWKTGLTKHQKGYIFTPIEKQGYLRIRISIAGKRKEIFVHRLVCEAFHGLVPTSKHNVAHEDGNPSNNIPQNLSWKTQAENIQDKQRHGTTMRGDNHYYRKLSSANVIEIRQLLEKGESKTVIAKKFNVTSATIYDIKRKKSWKHI